MAELLVCLALFYAWQRVLPPVTGAVVLARGARAFRPASWAWRSWWPGAVELVACRRPIRAAGGLLCGRDAAGGGATFAAAARARVWGRSVRAGGIRLCRGATPHHARRLGAAVRAVASRDAAGRLALLEALVGLALDAEHFACLRARGAPALRRLAWACNAYACLWLGVVSLAFFVPEDIVLWGMLPALAVGHLAACVALALAVRASLPEDRETAAEILLSGLLFPPALLGSPQALHDELTTRFHPAAVAPAILDRDGWLDLLRAELALLDRDAEAERASVEPDGGELRLLERERAELVALAERRGIGEGELRRPRSQRDPGAASYCVVCLTDYRGGVPRCEDCAVPTLAYAAADGD